MYIEDFESFFQQSAELFKARPLETRYCIKYRNCDGKLVLRVTDDRTVGAAARSAWRVRPDQQCALLQKRPSFQLRVSHIGLYDCLAAVLTIQDGPAGGPEEAGAAEHAVPGPGRQGRRCTR